MFAAGLISPHSDGAVLACRVTPRSSKSRIKGIRNGLLEVALSAPPLEGRANQELIAFLAKRLDRPRSSLSILRGERGREKHVLVSGMTPRELADLLAVEIRQTA